MQARLVCCKALDWDDKRYEDEGEDRKSFCRSSLFML
jgi:hypothetical protein